MRRNHKKGKLPRKRQFTPVLHRKRHTQRSFVRSFCVCLDGGSEGIRTPEPVKTTRFPIVPVMTTSIRFLVSARLFASVFYILYFFERFVKYFIGLFSINLLFENRTIVFKQRAQIIGGDESPKNYSTVFL